MARFRPSFIPLRPSSLRGISGPTSPVSPLSPCTPLHFPSPQPRRASAFSLSHQIAVEPPSIPMPWIWSCHKCHTRYLLGATRRCLIDGHYFCGGVTVDKTSGKVKKHKACVSEFDYSGWEDFSRWKRATTGQFPRFRRKHCEDECNFPSSCHWREEHAAQDMESTYHDPCCLDNEPNASSVKENLAIENDTENYVGKVGEEVERRTTQVSKTALSPIEEEDQKTLFLDATPKLNGLGLHCPVMGFSGGKNGAEDNREVAGNLQMKLTMPYSQGMVARVDSVWEEDVDMTYREGDDATENPPISPFTDAEGIAVPFDFKFDQDDGHATFLADEDSPVSPLCSTWHWRAEDIGVALSPPESRADCEMWEE